MIVLGFILGVALCVAGGYPFRDGYGSGENGSDHGWHAGIWLAFVVLCLLTAGVLYAGREITLRGYINGDFVIEKIPVVTKEIR